MSEVIRPMPSCTIDIATSARWAGQGAADETWVRRVVDAALPPGQAPCDLAVVFTDDDAIRALNSRFRGHDAPTNVLSFPAPPFSATIAGAPLPLGDVVIAFETAQREAHAQGKEFFHHVTHLLVHGVLHLLGYDHHLDADAESMEMRERAILMGLGIPDPYREHGDRPADPAAGVAPLAPPRNRAIDHPARHGDDCAPARTAARERA